MTRKPTRDSTPTDPLPVDRMLAATPAAWSPGVAFSGTVTVNGTVSAPPAGTTMLSGASIQVPAATDSSSAGSMLKRPVSVK